jgi:hypothetical protein
MWWSWDWEALQSLKSNAIYALHFYHTLLM